MHEEISKQLSDAILNFDDKVATKVAEKAVEAKINFSEAVTKMAEALREVGDRFQRGELYLPHVVAASDAMTAALKVIKPNVPKEILEKERLGICVLGTVRGDLHDIGKNVVSAMLAATGFEVQDLGRDVPTERFIEKALQVKADIIGVSSLLTTTLPEMRSLIEDLKRVGVRGKFKVIVGGGPTSPEWAEEIGADGYGADASEAVAIAKSLVGRKK